MILQFLRSILGKAHVGIVEDLSLELTTERRQMFVKYERD